MAIKASNSAPGSGPAWTIGAKTSKLTGTGPAPRLQRRDLVEVAQPVGPVPQNAARVGHLAKGLGPVDHARDMDVAGMSGKYSPPWALV